MLSISTEHENLSHFLSRATGALHERDKKKGGAGVTIK
jgi:hypothetical protein